MVIRGGASLVKYPPAFSNDGKRLLVCTASSVTVLSVATGLPVLYLNGHTDVVTGISVVRATSRGRSDVDHAWTSSLDGTLRLWDFAAGNIIETVTVGSPVYSMAIPGLSKPAAATPEAGVQDNLAFVSVMSVRSASPHNEIAIKDPKKGSKAKSGFTGSVLVFSLLTGKRLKGKLARTASPLSLFVSPNGTFVGTPDARKIKLWIVPSKYIEDVNAIRKIVLHHTKAFKVMAFDPTETVVAGGDSSGRILCWYNVGRRALSSQSVDKPTEDSGDDDNNEDDVAGNERFFRGGVRGDDDATACTTYHWHSHEVQSLVYSADGTYLFSGGSESVLVIWQPETGKQQFLPRFGATLCFITPSPDPSLFAISCSDNAIRFTNIGTMQIENSCQGIKPAVLLPKVMKSVPKVAFSPQGGRLVLPTDTLALQFYDTVRDQELFEVQVAPRPNLLVDKNSTDGWSGPSVFVTYVAFSEGGSSMATVDMRLSEDGVGGGSCLKFWDHDPQKQRYVLNTVVDDPHSADAEITALVYHSFEHMVVTTSSDATFKVWVATGGSKAGQSPAKPSAWRCRSVASYRHKKLLAAAFSPDGSLLAIAAEELITLWNPYTNGFLTCLSCVPLPQSIKLLAFVHNSKCLVAATSVERPRIIVWHLPTLSVLWSCDAYVEALSVDPNTAQFGIIALSPLGENSMLGSKDPGLDPDRKAVVAVFTPDQPVPTAAWSIREGTGGTLFFGPSNLLSSTSTRGANALQDKEGPPKASMIVVTGSREYVVLNPQCQDDSVEIDAPVATPLPDSTPSRYSDVYGKPLALSAPLTKEARMDVIGIRATKPWGELLDAPSHILPPLSRLGIPFMESLLQKQSGMQKSSS